MWLCVGDGAGSGHDSSSKVCMAVDSLTTGSVPAGPECDTIKNRGVEDVCIVVCDGLKVLPDPIGNTWPQTTIQTSLIHHEGG